MDLTNEILTLMNGFPISQITEITKAQVNSIAKSIKLQEVLSTLHNIDEDTTRRVYFTILVSRISKLDECDLNDVLTWCVEELNIPERDWVWYVDDYQMTKSAYFQQLSLKERIKGVLTVLREINAIHEDVILNRIELNVRLSWFFMDDLPWTDQTISSMTSKLLGQLSINSKDLINPIHDEFKELGKSERVTNAGYLRSQRINSGLKPKLSSFIVEDSRSLWKKQKIRSVSSIFYLLTKSSSKEVRDIWWLISPSILNILDDHEGPIKIIGVRLLSQLLDVVDVDYLRLTKLGVVYQDSLKPLLTYLPKMIPTKLSCLILNITYPTLIKLLLKMSENEQEHRKRLIDLLNSGIFATMNSVRDNFQILIILLSQMTNIIDTLQLHTLKTLPRLLNHLGSVLTDPFIDSSQELFEVALRCLIAIEVNCWPRLYQHRYDVLGMIAIGYKKEKNDKVIELISRSLIILKTIIKENDCAETYGKFLDDIELLCQSDESLRGLFE